MKLSFPIRRIVSLFLLLSVVACSKPVALGPRAEIASPSPTAPVPPCVPVESDFNWAEYQPRSMAALISNVNAVADLDAFKQSPPDSIYLEMSPEYTLPSSVAAEYRGEFRETSLHRMFAIVQWIRASRPSMTDEDVIALFRYEGRFTAGLESYWLPIQTKLAQAMQGELKPGDEVDLYMRWIGLTKPDNRVDYVFLVNAWHDKSKCRVNTKRQVTKERPSCM